MPLNPELLEIIVCPDCHGKLELADDESALRCLNCHRVYPVRDGIPVLLIDESVIEEPSAA